MKQYNRDRETEKPKTNEEKVYLTSIRGIPIMRTNSLNEVIQRIQDYDFK